MKIGITRGAVINVGNYETRRIEIYMEIDSTVELHKEVYETLLKEVNEVLAIEIRQIKAKVHD